MTSQLDRHLAAVLALDIVGYSRLMGSDEQGTLERVLTRRKTLIDPAVNEHRGRVVKGTGDGILATFASAQDAIRAALRIQAALAEANANEPSGLPMTARIGITIGDILFEEDGDIFGDGVNIAARLEAVAPPGGICVSARALDDLRRVGTPFTDLGDIRLKNIAQPVHAYCIPANAAAGMHTTTPAPGVQRPAIRWRRPLLLGALTALLIGLLALFALYRGGGSHPVVLVEPLHASEHDEIAQALGHNLSADLASMIVSNNATIRIADAADTAVAGRALADYVVTGDVRNDGNKLHLSVRLLGNRDNGIIWSSDFTRPAAEAEALREQVVVRIADVVTCALGSAQTPREQLPVATLKLFLAGCELRHTDWQAASKFFRQVTEQVPTLAEPWAYYATSLAETANDAPGVDSTAVRRDARAAANRALALDPNIAEAYFALAITTPTMADWQTKTRLVEKGLKIDPENPELLISRFYSLWAIGRIKDAAGPARRAADQSPFAPLSAANLAQHLAYSGEVAAALKLLGQAHDRWPREPLIEEPGFGIVARVGDPAAAAALIADPAAALNFSPAQRAGWAALISARMDPATAKRAAAAIVALANDSELSTQLDFVQHLTQLGYLDAAYKLALALPKLPTPVEAVWFRGYMASFRRDPRFMQLAAEQGIAPVWLQTGIWPDFCVGDTELRYDCREAALAAVGSASR